MNILGGDALRSASVLQLSLYTTSSRDKVADLSTITDLAMEDYKSNEVLSHCPACNAVRWYILVPDGVYQEMSMFPGDKSSIITSDQTSSSSPSVPSSSTTPNSEGGRYYELSSFKQPASDIISTILACSNDLTLISGYIASAEDRPRGFHLACRYLDNLLAPILGCIPDIDGYELAPLHGQPEHAAGRQLMVHARVLNDFTNLPANTTFLPHGPAREPCVTELVLPGAYENLSPVVAKPKSPVVHRRKESEDSGIGLVAEMDEESDMEIEMEME